MIKYLLPLLALLLSGCEAELDIAGDYEECVFEHVVPAKTETAARAALDVCERKRQQQQRKPQVTLAEENRRVAEAIKQRLKAEKQAKAEERMLVVEEHQRSKAEKLRRTAAEKRRLADLKQGMEAELQRKAAKKKE